MILFVHRHKKYFTQVTLTGFFKILLLTKSDIAIQTKSIFLKIKNLHTHCCLKWIIGKKWYAFKTIYRRFSVTFHKHLVWIRNFQALPMNLLNCFPLWFIHWAFWVYSNVNFCADHWVLVKLLINKWTSWKVVFVPVKLNTGNSCNFLFMFYECRNKCWIGKF